MLRGIVGGRGWVRGDRVVRGGVSVMVREFYVQIQLTDYKSRKESVAKPDFFSLLFNSLTQPRHHNLLYFQVGRTIPLSCGFGRKLPALTLCPYVPCSDEKAALRQIFATGCNSTRELSHPPTFPAKRMRRHERRMEGYGEEECISKFLYSYDKLLRCPPSVLGYLIAHLREPTVCKNLLFYYPIRSLSQQKPRTLQLNAKPAFPTTNQPHSSLYPILPPQKKHKLQLKPLLSTRSTLPTHKNNKTSHIPKPLKKKFPEPKKYALVPRHQTPKSSFYKSRGIGGVYSSYRVCTTSTTTANLPLTSLPTIQKPQLNTARTYSLPLDPNSYQPTLI